jgi:hypothetical protein
MARDVLMSMKDEPDSFPAAPLEKVVCIHSEEVFVRYSELFQSLGDTRFLDGLERKRMMVD